MDIIKTGRKAVGRIRQFLQPTYLSNRKCRIIFVLSAGRCGSTSITQMFNQHPRFLAFHEAFEELIELSTTLAEKPHERNLVKKKLHFIFGNTEWPAKKGEIIVHSDHRLWNLVDLLKEYFPNAFFVHLIRNPKDSVLSFYKRKWYHPEELQFEGRKKYVEYRIKGNKMGEISTETWKALLPMEKIIWYWNFVNLKIYEQMKSIEANSTTVPLEDLTLKMNAVIKPTFALEHDFLFKEVVSNIDETEIDHDVLLHFSQALEVFGGEATNRFYPKYLQFK